MSLEPFRYRVCPNIEFTEPQLETLYAILDTYIAPLTKEEEDLLVEKLKATHSEQEVREFCQYSSSSLQSLESIKSFIDRVLLPEKRQELLLLLSVLSSKAGSFAMTGYLNEFKNLSREEREKVLLGWRNSSISKFRMIYKTFHALACLPSYSHHAKELGRAMKYNGFDQDQKYENVPPRFQMLTPDEITDNMEYDVIVIGSGAGGGVVASQLAKSGKSVLVIEKGAYHHESEFVATEADAFANLYEHGGFTPSFEGTISNLAGSVFGGGTTVNWSASLKLQHFVREEWAKQGLTYFLSPKFTEDLDRVFERIGASTEGIKHNGPNQILVDGCKVLGYPIADIPQNTGGKPHECETCFMGCRAGIKNGTMNSWLRDAAEHGAKFMERTKVIRVLTENNKATGVECLVNYDRPVTIRAQQVVVSGGSLQSPGILLRSGLKNKNIGRHLHLHPCTIAFGYFDREVRPFEGSIMTAVSCIAENVDNDGYGCKIEVPSLHPGAYAAVMQWRGAASHKEAMLRYSHFAPLLILARDKDSEGVVRYDDKDNSIVDYNLSKRDRRSLTVGIERSANILVAAGAREIYTGQFGIEPFVFREDEESRIDNERFVAWKQAVIRYGFPFEGGALFGAHQMGSNRMGVSPKTSVVKPTGETWEVKDLYVADASVFPTASGVNPMVTTETIALHIADGIVEGYTQSKL
ncbi:Long-chain-alcohol oxidase FAO2 [Choanephora cucurbitarum]|uniref:Long-chain-alcohol oxidase n=1 Tax=Choanephora cucurbitarum TaxID=101091 RepID=A0A1C7N507_9FUNG|nr:Long-chain-alcohol oxidase FAO2 [Choanephora cucurbitarum]